MRALFLTRHGGPEVLAVREAETPVPGPGEVRIAVRFAGLNFTEVAARQGLYPDAPPPPCVLGYEGSGVVESVGSGVSSLSEGDRVLFLSRFGAQAEAVCVPEGQAVRLPEPMSFEEAAALPVNYLTAHHILFRVARIQPGHRVLIHMAAGGVGTAALQLCRAVDGVVTYGTASSHKHDHLRAQGCHHPIDYHRQDYAEAIRHLTDGEGVDVVLDALGGPDWRKGYGLLRPGGMLVAFGLANVTSGPRRRWLHVARQVLQVPVFTPMKLMNDNRAVAGVNVGHLWDHVSMLRGQLEALLEAYVAGHARPHVHGVFSFDRAAEAQGEIEGRRNLGKVLLAP